MSEFLMQQEIDKLKEQITLYQRRFKDFELHNHGGIDSSFVDFSSFRKQIEWVFPSTSGTNVVGTVGNHATINLIDGVSRTAILSWMKPPLLLVDNIELVWSSSAASGNARFQIEINAGQKGTANDIRITAGTAFEVATIGANLLNYTSFKDKGDTNLSSLVPGDIVSIFVTRQGAHANDTLSASVGIYGVKITYI